MIALICFVLAVLASPFKSKSRLEALGGFTIVTSGLSFRYAPQPPFRKPQYFATRQTVRQNVLLPLMAQTGDWPTSTDGGGFDVVKKTKDLNVPWRLARISHASYVGADDRLGRGRKIGIARLVIGLLPATAYFADAARRAGLKVVVNMSQISAREDSKSYAARDHWIAERLFDWSGVPTVHLRPTFFSEWLSLPSVRSTIVFALPKAARRKTVIFERGRVPDLRGRATSAICGYAATLLAGLLFWKLAERKGTLRLWRRNPRAAHHSRT